jgi:hypothetical protein
MPGFSAIAVAPIGALSQDAIVGVGSLRLGVSVPLPAVYNSAIAAFPIADLPYINDQSVTVTTGVNAALASQSLALTENSVLINSGHTIEVAGQVLLSTLSSVTITTSVEITMPSQSLTAAVNSVAAEVQPPAFDSQSINSVLNSAGLITDVTLSVASQSLSSSVNSVAFATSVNVFITPLGPILHGDNWAIAATPIGSLPEPCPYIATGMSLSETSVSLNLDVVLTAASQSMLFTENSVSLITDQNIVAPSQTIYTTLNSLREWIPIPTPQPKPGTCPDHCDGKWTTIAYDEVVRGDDWAIAGYYAIGSLPQALPPIRKYPGSAWTNVPAQTTTTWKSFPT